MNPKDLVAPCGIECHNCGAYEKNITEGVKKVLADMSGKNPSQTICKGCRITKGT